MARAGGQSPDSYGLSHTVTVPNASKDTPVQTGQPLVLTTGGGYEADFAGDGVDFNLIAKHPVEDDYTPLGVWVVGFSRVNKMAYSGTAPTIGSAVVSAGDGTVRAADGGATPPETGVGFVLYVDTSRNYVEVALP